MSAEFVPHLRICPLCFEAAYHSYWHQSRWLKARPLHGVSLEQHCQSCAAALPLWSLSTQLLATPFLCSACGAPIAGAPLLVSTHVELRQQADMIAQQFGSVMDWSKHFVACRRQLMPTHAYGLPPLDRAWAQVAAAPITRLATKKQIHAPKMTLLWVTPCAPAMETMDDHETVPIDEISTVYRATLRLSINVAGRLRRQCMPAPWPWWQPILFEQTLEIFRACFGPGGMEAGNRTIGSARSPVESSGA